MKLEDGEKTDEVQHSSKQNVNVANLAPFQDRLMRQSTMNESKQHQNFDSTRTQTAVSGVRLS